MNTVSGESAHSSTASADNDLNLRTQLHNYEFHRESDIPSGVWYEVYQGQCTLLKNCDAVVGSFFVQTSENS